jgi:hypothetical protein
VREGGLFARGNCECMGVSGPNAKPGQYRPGSGYSKAVFEEMEYGKFWICHQGVAKMNGENRSPKCPYRCKSRRGT